MQTSSNPRFGYPFDRRLKEMAATKPSASGATYRVEIKGKTVDLPIIRVPIELPKYRLSNGRTASLQEQWLANHPSEPLTFFEADPELDEAQTTQHELLFKLVKEAGLLTYFVDARNRQIDPILLDEHGFVINGNRRLCCWRHLHHSEPGKYPSYSHIDVVVLPHCDEKEIDRIEANIQVKKDIRANYSWESTAIMMRQKQTQHGFTDADLADMYDMTETEVRQTRARLELAGEYLKSRGRLNQWSDVSDDEEAFKQLLKTLKRTSTAADAELVKRAAFALIDRPMKSGERLYSAIPKIQEHFQKVKEKLAEAFPVQQPRPDPEMDGLFGDPAAKKTASVPLVAEVSKEDNWEQVRKIVVEVITSQAAISREKQNAEYLVRMLAGANSQLQAAVADGLRVDSSRAGAEEQIRQIEAAISTIRRWLAT